MIDRPDTPQLLSAMADALEAEMGYAPDSQAPRARYTLRIVANLCRILARENQLGLVAREQTRRDLAELLGVEGSLPELVALLDETLRDERNENSGAAPESVTERPAPAHVHAVLVADVDRRLAIARPDYAVGDQ